MCRESVKLIRWGLMLVSMALIAIGCLEQAESPRPLPPVQPDAFDFDPREPIRMPGIGSGYGSGVVAPTGRGPTASTGAPVDSAFLDEDTEGADAEFDGGIDEDLEDEATD